VRRNAHTALVYEPAVGRGAGGKHGVAAADQRSVQRAAARSGAGGRSQPTALAEGQSDYNMGGV
jgi:hypothetical protein